MHGARSLIRDIQLELLQLYDLQLALDANDFLSSDRADVHRHLPQSREQRECLLVAQQGDELGLTLFLAPELLQQLAEADPRAGLHDGNLDAFLAASEGLSHFIYLAWNAQHDRSVTRLELELQAEVDKLALCARHFHTQHGNLPDDLVERLYVAFRDAPGLSDEERERYRYANDLAARYATRLRRDFALDPRHNGLRTELRRFYRMSQRAKLERIGG